MNRFSLPAMGFACVFFLSALLGSVPVSSSNAQALDVPFVPTPHEVVTSMLELAETRPDDLVIDLGSGDGRIVIAAIAEFGVSRAIGVDLDPVRIRQSLTNAEAAGVLDRARFVEGNVFDFDFGDADVVTMYLLQSINLRLRPRILELRPGTRVVSHRFDMGEWQPDAFLRQGFASVFMWVVPAKLEGAWLAEDGKRLDLEQSFQVVRGTLTQGNARLRLRAVDLHGDRLRFEVRLKGESHVFDGVVSRERIEGQLGSQPVTFRRGG